MAFIFTKNMVIPDTYYRKIAAGILTMDDVPNLYNLRAVVESMLQETI